MRQYSDGNYNEADRSHVYFIIKNDIPTPISSVSTKDMWGQRGAEKEQRLFLMVSGANKAETELMGGFIWDRFVGLQKKGIEEAAP